MRTTYFWKLVVLCAALALAACKPAAETDGAGSGEEAAAEGDEAAAEGDEAAAEGDEAAAEAGEEAAEEPTSAPTGEAAADEGTGDEAAADAPTSVTAENLHGTWGLDLESVIADAPEEQREMMRAMLSALSISMEFGADGSFAMRTTGGPNGEEDVKEGTFVVDGVEGNVITVTATVPTEEEPTSTLLVTFNSMDSVAITEADGAPGAPTLHFARL